MTAQQAIETIQAYQRKATYYDSMVPTVAEVNRRPGCKTSKQEDEAETMMFAAIRQQLSLIAALPLAVCIEIADMNSPVRTINAMRDRLRSNLEVR